MKSIIIPKRMTNRLDANIPLSQLSVPSIQLASGVSPAIPIVTVDTVADEGKIVTENNTIAPASSVILPSQQTPINNNNAAAISIPSSKVTTLEDVYQIAETDLFMIFKKKDITMIINTLNEILGGITTYAELKMQDAITININANLKIDVISLKMDTTEETVLLWIE